MHILSDLQVSDVGKLTSGDECIALLRKTIDSVGVQNIGEVIYEFENGGFTVSVCLAESHVSIHTWPELARMSLDVYLCNYKRDNTERAEAMHAAICDYFDPSAIETTRLNR
jgi:S-adenosylmethionine decarboxylase